MENWEAVGNHHEKFLPKRLALSVCVSRCCQELCGIKNRRYDRLPPVKNAVANPPDATE